jgi:hypothetical protein
MLVWSASNEGLLARFTRWVARLCRPKVEPVEPCDVAASPKDFPDGVFTDEERAKYREDHRFLQGPEPHGPRVKEEELACRKAFGAAHRLEKES